MRAAIVGIALTLLLADGTLFTGKCPICLEHGKKSTVTPGGGITTSLYYGDGYYDEEGRYHSPETCNTTSYQYTCSRGHLFFLDEASY